MEYLLHILVLIGIYSILSVSLDLIAGYTGLLSIAHAAFFGVGAYVAALMSLRLGSPFIVAVLSAVAVAGVTGALVGLPSLRIQDDYFVMASFAFQVIAFSVLNNWGSLTGGPMGLPGIPEPRICGWQLTSHLQYLLVVWFFAALTVWVVRRIVKSPMGRVLKAIREDEVFAQAAGKNAGGYKVTVFVIGAMLAAPAGAMYAYYISYIDPTSFTVMESVFMISIVIIGGAGSIWGPLVGAAVLVALPEALRFVGMPDSVAANMRQVMYGVALVACMLWRPQGIIGDYAFTRSRARQ